jgi:hypothetical protein
VGKKKKQQRTVSKPATRKTVLDNLMNGHMDEPEPLVQGWRQEAVSEIEEAPEPDDVPDPAWQRLTEQIRVRRQETHGHALTVAEVVSLKPKIERIGDQYRLLELLLLGLDQKVVALGEKMDLVEQEVAGNTKLLEQIITMINSERITDPMVAKALRIVRADRARIAETSTAHGVGPQGED